MDRKQYVDKDATEELKRELKQVLSRWKERGVGVYLPAKTQSLIQEIEEVLGGGND